MNKKIILPVFATVIGAGMLLNTNQVSAQNFDKDTMIQRLAQKLGLEESKVQNAMDQLRSERQSEMQKNLEAKLTTAVKDGKITESQKQAILAKHREMQEKHLKMRDEFREMTPEQRREAKEKMREEMENWAKQNGLDLKEFLGVMGRHGMRMKMKFMR